MRKPHLRTGLERLEQRRLLSADPLFGPIIPVTESSDYAEYVGPIGLGAVGAGAVIMGPSRTWASPGVVAQGVVGSTASTGIQPAGALSGKIVYTVGGHGFTAFASGWHTQRGEVTGTEMVEDLGNQDQMTFYVNHLFNAGATVVPLRPVGYQPSEVILDNDDAGVTFTGTWSNSSSTHFYGSPGDVPYRYASVASTQTATAKFTPNISVAGFYPVYTWARAGSDRINQLYRVAHSGGITEVRIDHRRVGNGYVYLGTYHFNSGTAGYVEISNQGTNAGSSVVIADHIRFGNGMGDINRGQGVSGQTRSDESALYWIEHQRGQGVDDSQFRGSLDTDDNDNVGAPPRWARWMNREQAGAATDRVFLSFHSNAGGGRGTVGLFNGNNDPGAKTPFQAEWADLVAREVRDDMFAIGSPPLEHAWWNRTLTWDRPDYEFGEINNLVIGNEFDATILEVAFHDSTLDGALMRDPKVRDWVARASLQATIKYFNQFGGSANTTAPSEAPTHVRAVTQANGDVIVSWAAPLNHPGGGNPASGYVVYSSPNGYGFGNAVAVAGAGTLSLTIPAAQVTAGANYFRVSATNAGGESMPTEVVAARNNAGAKILIVNGFDRIDRTLNPTQTTSLSYNPPGNSGSNTFERVRPRSSNSYDYVVQAAEAMKNYGAAPLRIDTASNEAVAAGQVNLGSYAAVVWLSGEESTVDKTFDATEQALVSTYLNNGGKLFVSGSEIGFDLDAGGNGASFYNSQLRADYVADSGGSYTATGVAGSIFAGISLTFDSGSGGTYDVNSPDRIIAINGSSVAMNYSGAGSGGAAIQYANLNGGRVVYMAFPFETITSAANRNAVMTAVLNYFGQGNPVGSITGRVIRDVNGNGITDAGEIGLSGWAVYLDVNNDSVLNPGEQYTTTPTSGDWSFIDLPVGSYNVRVVQQTGWQRTAPGGAGAFGVNVTAGSAASDLQFTQFKTGYIGSSGADQYTLRMDPANNGRVEIIETLSGQAPFTWSIAKSVLSSLSFSGGAGDDKLTIDHALASPIPAGGVSFDGGASGPFAGDQIVMNGTAGSDVVTAAAGAIGFGGNVSYLGVERIVLNLLGGDDALTYNNPTAPVTFNGGASSTSDVIVVAGGTWTLDDDAIVGTDRLNVTVSAGASAVFNATQHLNALTIAGSASVTAGAGKTVVTKSLNITGSGRLDLTDNDLVIDYSGASPIGSVMSWLATGRNGGDWLGNGIRTSTAGSAGVTGLGIAEASAVRAFSGGTALFGGETVDASSLLIKYTYGGDANLDGFISGDDYTAIDFAIATAGMSGWSNGDFNYDGIISADDYTMIDFNIMAQGPAL